MRSGLGSVKRSMYLGRRRRTRILDLPAAPGFQRSPLGLHPRGAAGYLSKVLLATSYDGHTHPVGVAAIRALARPEFFAEKGIFISTAVGRGEGDCGSYQVFRLMDAPGETFEFQLMEYREKVNCDGVQSEPSEWPLQFQAGE
jgi:hypothetical protein